MANYNQVNIYRKQMQDLGLNTKQYARLINMPYEVVKDIIYDKEGEYSMDIKNLLRKNMMDKHQEIENDIDNAKFKAMEIKNEVDYLSWYKNEYNVEMLKRKLKLRKITDFIRNYNIEIFGQRASDWTYQVLVGKKEYKGHSIDSVKKLEFIRQLYDILVNGNGKEYYKKYTKTKNKQIIADKQYYNKDGIKNADEYIKWYNDFDVLKYMKENNLTNAEFAKKLNLAYSTLCFASAKTRASLKTIVKLYDYVQSHTNNIEEQDDLQKIFKDVKEMPLENEPIIIKKEEPTIIINNDEILRKILISRLTDEEKMLIELFGGKIC